MSITSDTPHNPICFRGDGASYFGIWIVNILLTFLTLGIYSAWAKVRTNQYFYGHTELAGERFEYLATPIQILIGRLIAVAMVVAWAILSNIPLVGGLMMLAFALAVPYLIVRGLRFNARVSRYRNIRFNFEADYLGAYRVYLFLPFLCYAGLIGGFAVLSLVAGESAGFQVILGLALMVMVLVINAYLAAQSAKFAINNYRWGEHAFSAALSWKKYFKIFLVTGLIGVAGLLVLLLVLGLAFGGSTLISTIQTMQAGGESPAGAEAVMVMMLFGFYLMMIFVSLVSSSYMMAAIRNYQFSQTQLGEHLSLDSQVKVWPFVWLITTNFLLVAFTLGFGAPFAKVRKVRFLAAATSVEGDIESLVAQNQVQDSNSAIGDEVAEAFDVEFGVI